MTWFKVDDSFHSHPKAAASSLAALGLWTAAGAWSGDHLTDGFLPDHMIPLLSRGATKLADELVAAGLWRRVKGGYRFHDWAEYNPTAESVKTERKAARERMRKVRENRKIDGKPPGQTANGSGEHGANVREVFGRSSATPTRPDPTRIGGSSLGVTTDRARASPDPPPRCEEHLNDPHPPPCGSCADARRAADTRRAERDARINTAPQCARHRGEIAANCRSCAAEAKGAA